MVWVTYLLLAALPSESLPSDAGWEIAFGQTPAISAFARATTAAAEAPKDRAHLLYDALLELKKSGAIEGDRDNSPKSRPPKTADELWRRVSLFRDDPETGLNRQAGCYELTSLFIAGARSIGLDAVGVERTDADGTGQIGHVMAGVRLTPGGPVSVFDLQNETRGTRFVTRVLTDRELAAHHYNHGAVAAFLNRNLDAAEDAITLALLLDPDSPSFSNNRATILAAKSEWDLAVADAVYAIEQAPTVPLYRYQLGRIHLANGKLREARRSLAHALQLRPTYSLARRDLGWTLLLAGQRTPAWNELKRASAEGAPDGFLYLGLYGLAEGSPNHAFDAARQGLMRTPKDSRLLALKALASDTLNGEAPADDDATAGLLSVLANVSQWQKRHGTASFKKAFPVPQKKAPHSR